MTSGSLRATRTVSRKARLSRAGHRNLDDLFAQLTWLWNIARHRRKQAWEADRESVSYHDQCRTLTRARRDPAWSRFSVLAQRSVLKRLDLAYKAFFRRVGAGEEPGHPRFKSEHRGVRSFSLSTPVKTDGRKSWVVVKGVGRIGFKGGLPDGAVKLVRVCRTVLGVKVQLVVERDIEVVPDERPMVGIDMGVTNRIALSTGETVPGVKPDRAEIKRRQRRLDKARRGGANRRKRKAELAREWARTTARERGAAHELSARLIRHVSANIAVENLEIPNMVRNPHLARAIHEQQWGTLVRMLTYKAESAGGSVVRVPPHHTSRECSACGRRRDMPLSVRTYRCSCGLVLDRDVNAARNVLQRGMSASNPGGDIPGTRGAGRRAASAASAKKRAASA